MSHSNVKQTKLTDYFNKRKQYRSPAAKRKKLQGLEKETFVCPTDNVVLQTPDVTFAAAAEQLLISRRKRKGSISDRISNMTHEAFSPDVSSCSSGNPTPRSARRQLKFATKQEDGLSVVSTSIQKGFTTLTSGCTANDTPKGVSSRPRIVPKLAVIAAEDSVAISEISNDPEKGLSFSGCTATSSDPPSIPASSAVTSTIAAESAATVDSGLTVPRSPSKLSSLEVKKRLGKITNLQQLRERLATFSSAAAKLNEHRSVADALADERCDTAIIKTATSLPSPVKSPPADLPEPAGIAFDRFQHLITQTEVQLPLPTIHRNLFDTFSFTDTVVMLMYNRLEMITFDRLKNEVEKGTHRAFSVKTLGQIRTVYPEAYNMDLCLCSTRFTSPDSSKKEVTKLVIAPNLDTDLDKYRHLLGVQATTPVKACRNLSEQLSAAEECSKSPQTKAPETPRKSLAEPKILRTPCKTPIKQSPRKGEDQNNERKFTVNRQVCRRTIFRHNLVEILKENHKTFLRSLQPPVELSVEEESQLKRWHPAFLSSKISNIEAVEIPTVPAEKVYTAKELLSHAKDHLPGQVRRALELTSALNTKAKTKESPAAKQSIKGLPEALLTKIREKEAIKQQLSMLRNPAEDERQLRLSRLPDLIRIIRTLFLCQNKAVLPLQTVVNKIADSYRSVLNADDIHSHIRLLEEFLPDWIKEVRTASNNASFLKINCSTELSCLLRKVELQTQKK